MPVAGTDETEQAVCQLRGRCLDVHRSLHRCLLRSGSRGLSSELGEHRLHLLQGRIASSEAIFYYLPGEMPDIAPDGVLKRRHVVLLPLSRSTIDCAQDDATALWFWHRVIH